jgi:hypothetical protein
MKSFIKVLCAATMAVVLNACSTMNNEEAAPSRYSDLHFDNKKPIQLMVKKVDIRSDFTPSFTRPNVEHLFPVSIEKTAKTWAGERLEAVDYSSDRIAEFVIEDASVTEREEKATQLLEKDRVKYFANLSVSLKVTDKKSSAQTTVKAYRELSMPIDTNIEDKEKYWNEMVIKLFSAFDESMEQNANKYLNMYIKGDTSVAVY